MWLLPTPDTIDEAARIQDCRRGTKFGFILTGELLVTVLYVRFLEQIDASTILVSTRAPWVCENGGRDR